MATYSLIGSYSTVQVVSPTQQLEVIYCTIQTHPSNVYASIPVSTASFSDNQGAVQLTNFSNAIEQIMSNTNVIAGTGSQTIDATGLLTDNVVFTVQYTSSTIPPGQVTAEAIVPVGLLNFSDGQIGSLLLEEVDAIINGVYNNLKNAASG